FFSSRRRHTRSKRDWSSDVCSSDLKSFAQKVGAIDVPRDARRVHDHPIPRMGGMAIFLGFLISVLLFVDISRPVRGILLGAVLRSEERRVGKEGGARGGAHDVAGMR